jgi:hypothetical protein
MRWSKQAEVADSKNYTEELAGTLKKLLPADLNALRPANRINATPQPTPKKARINFCQEMMSKLRKERREMMASGESSEDIGDITRRIDNYKSECVNLENEFFSEGKASARKDS